MRETLSISDYQPNGGDNDLGADNPQGRSINQLKPSETSTLPLRKFRVRDLAYAAGLIDGEGCISAHFGDGHPFVFVKVTNTDLPMLEWIKETFGGRIQIKGGVLPDNWKQSWDWYCATEDLIPFLKLMIPHLKTKRKRAYLAMAIRRCIELKKDRTRIEKLIDKIKIMNLRGRYSPAPVAISG